MIRPCCPFARRMGIMLPEESPPVHPDLCLPALSDTAPTLSSPASCSLELQGGGVEAQREKWPIVMPHGAVARCSLPAPWWEGESWLSAGC